MIKTTDPNLGQCLRVSMCVACMGLNIFFANKIDITYLIAILCVQWYLFHSIFCGPVQIQRRFPRKTHVVALKRKMWKLWVEIINRSQLRILVEMLVSVFFLCMCCRGGGAQVIERALWFITMLADKLLALRAETMNHICSYLILTIN